MHRRASIRRPRWAALLLSAGLLAAAAIAAGCSSGNPVEPPVPVPPSGPSSPVSVKLTPSLGSVEAGSPVGTTITVTAQPAPPDGTQAKLNTSLGNFGVDAAGMPMKLVTLQLVGGSAATTFYGGSSDTGTASILAQVGTSTGSLNLPIVPPAAKPQAGFSFAVGGLSVIFTDTSTGNPTDWTWDFGDGTRSHLENPTHTYAGATSYLVTLTVLAAGGKSTARQFVTLQPPAAVTAAFSAAVNGLTVLFTNQSTGNPTSFSWNFGDCLTGGGNPGCTSSQSSPSHVYAVAGTYTVSLSVSNASGASDSASQFVSVGVTGKPPQAAFDFQGSGLTVTFADRSTGGPTGWSWNFGDGAISTQQNPTHAYTAAGTYNVTLTAANAAGQSSASKFVTVPGGTAPQANFTFQASGLTVAFADTSTGGPTSWTWNFGDCPSNASCTSSQQNPTHTYAAAGTYTVTLTAANAAGQSSKPELVTVTATPPPQAAFSFQTSGLNVVFADQSTGGPTSWSWNFGDCPANPGCSSSQQNPTHTYAAAGTYTVTLTVGNSAGTNSVSKLVTVSTSQPPQARFCYQRNQHVVSFSDVSANAPTSWQWNFGDCPTQPVDCQSSAQNPTHTYGGTGTLSFTVSLQATNASGQGSVNHVITVNSTGPPDPAPICP
jgi:PKD repeat protein